MTVVLRVTAIGAGSVEYLLRGCGCAEHEHAPELDQGLELGEELERKHGHDHKYQEGGREQTGADYLSRNAGVSEDHEPAGMWWGEGLDMVGREAGMRARASDVRAVFGELRHPESTAQEPEWLGRKPRVFKSTEERIEAALAAEPDASEERIWQIRNQIGGDQRKAVAYYDLTFSAPKSVSVYYAALLAAGRDADAQRMWEMHQAAVDEAMGFIQTECAYVRSGYHGRTRDGRSVGRYEEGSGLVGIRFDHRTSRAQEPQLHSHFAVLNRLVTRSDGTIRALDGRGFAPVKAGADAIYLAGLERRMTAGFQLVFALRPDGKAREILGVDQRLCAEASTRSAQVRERTAQLVAEYRTRTGRTPSPARMKKIRQGATLATRASKSSVPPGRQVATWTSTRVERLRSVVVEVAARAAERAGRDGADQRNLVELDRREQLAVAAVSAVQVKYSTWTVGNLIAELHTLRDTPCDEGELRALAEQVLANPARFGVQDVSAPDPGSVPVELRRADGRSRFRSHNEERYATAEHLAVENGIVAAARVRDGAALTGNQAELARRELAGRGLGQDQLAAAVGVLTSGRRGDVLIGPAGVGKSRTVAGIAAVWERQLGGRVIGLATSKRATDVLIDDNGMNAMTVATFLLRYSPDEEGRVSELVRPGDLYVLDEASMVATDEIRRISEIIGAGGGKLLYTGDPAQLAAVGAGGMLDLLVRDNGAHRLVEVHRFTAQWEKDASVRLRAGDSTVLEEYHVRGRLRGGSAEQLSDDAVRGYLADTVDGKSSTIVVDSNERAAEVSAQVRAELIRLGRVNSEVVGSLRDGTHVGIGDLVQARRNDYDIRVDGVGLVTNRQSYTVLGADPDGTLRVRATDGSIAHLPADYVRNHLTLAYATTVHAVQGVTLDTCHALISEHSRLEALYVAMTRGRESNTAYVETQAQPDQHRVTPLDTTPISVITQIMRHSASEDEQAIRAASAELTRRVGVASGASLASVGTQWDLLTTEAGIERYTEQLSELLDEDTARRVLAEPGFNQLTHALRASELAGHDTRAVLAEAIGERSLGDAESVSDVLRWRINHSREHREIERDVRAGDWTTLSAPIAGARGEWAQVLAEAATAEQARLGAAAWADPPEWALHLLGAPPTGHSPADQAQAEEWIHQAGMIAAYRDLANIEDTALSLGPAPAAEQVFHRALWQQAFAAAGCPAEDHDFRVATDSQLYAMRARYQREEVWAPYFVGDELAQAREEAEIHRQDARLWQAEADAHPVGSYEHEQAEADAAIAQRAAQLAVARAEQLQPIHDHRAEWAASVETARTAYVQAGDELARRGLDRDLTPAVVEQPALFEALDSGPDGADDEPDQLRLDLSGSTQGDERVVVTRVPAPAARAEPELRTSGASADRSDQHALFAAEPEPAAIVAGQPLRTRPEPGDHEVTVGEAHREAEISARLRAGRELRSQVTEWEHDLNEAAAEKVRAERARRERGEELVPEYEQTLSARREGPAQSLGLR